MKVSCADIVHQVRIAHHARNQALDAPLVLDDQHLESPRVAVLRTLDQRPVGVVRVHGRIFGAFAFTGFNRLRAQRAQTGWRARRARPAPPAAASRRPSAWAAVRDRSAKAAVQPPRSNLACTAPARSGPMAAGDQRPCPWRQASVPGEHGASIRSEPPTPAALRTTTATHATAPRPAGPAAASTCDHSQAPTTAAQRPPIAASAEPLDDAQAHVQLKRRRRSAWPSPRSSSLRRDATPRVPLVPPKPKLFFAAASMRISRASLAQ